MELTVYNKFYIKIIYLNSIYTICHLLISYIYLNTRISFLIILAKKILFIITI